MAESQLNNNYQQEEDLKNCNVHLMSQLQLGLSELKTMVSNYPQTSNNTTQISSENPTTHTQQQQQQQQHNASSSKEFNIKEVKENIKMRRSSRSTTSTPKSNLKKRGPTGNNNMLMKTNVKKRVSTGKSNTPLSKNAHSLLISDTGNLKPMRKTNLNKSKKSPIKSILRSSKRLKTPQKAFDIGNLKPIRNTTLNKSNNKLSVKPILQLSRCSKTPRKSNRVCFSPMINNVSEKKGVDTTMMGYDWIAGMLDNDMSINDQPDDFFEELKEFRKANWNECKSIKSTDTNINTCETSLQLSPALKHTEKENYPLCCTGNGAYMLNNRLNLVPIHGPYSACPVCKSKPQSRCDADGYVRVSIPRSTIKSPYRLRPHRRKSFDPSDSVALSMHCLAGWQASKPACIRGPSNIDLASHTAKPGLTSVKALKDATFKC